MLGKEKQVNGGCKAPLSAAQPTSPGDENTRQSLPRDLTKLTLAQVEWCVAYHAAMPLSEIRRRQELTDQQIGLAWRPRNDFALANLRVREEILRRAADRKLPPLDGVPGNQRMKPRPQVHRAGVS